LIVLREDLARPAASEGTSSMPKKRIFVSATSRDLGSYRELASKAMLKRG
jgi:hypothetical protein